MAYGLDHLFHATNFVSQDNWFFDRVYEWRAKRDSIAVLLEDLPKLVDAEKHAPSTTHPNNPNMGTLDPRPSIRLATACEGIANALYSASEIAANFANLVSGGLIPNSFNRIRAKCEQAEPPGYALVFPDLQWYRKVRELRTEWAHFSAIFVGKDDADGPLLCVKSFRRHNDRREFREPSTICRVEELCEWVMQATGTLEAFAGYLLTTYVIPRFDMDAQVAWMVRDEGGFPKFNHHGGLVTERITMREYLRRGGIDLRQ